MHLVKHLREEGAEVMVTDVNEAQVAEAVKEHGAKAVGLEEIYDVDCDVYAPCALGATLNDLTIPRLKCAVVAGAANNQLEDEAMHGKQVRDKGILYAPDFLINAGGLINCYAEYRGNYTRAHALEMTEVIYGRTLEIFDAADKEAVTPHRGGTPNCPAAH